MSAPEMINELKRLSSVVTSLEGVIVELQTSNANLITMITEQVASNINLANMIAQQIITNANLVDSVTELQNSNVNLANMIAQQVITNTNLTNSITELQNQVVLQTATNVNLTNMITELQTSVTRLTTITGQLVTVNIRALDNTDIPHQGLPYNYIPVEAAQIGIIANNTTGGVSFSAADWGAGLDYYVFSVVIEFRMPETVYWKWWHGIDLTVYENADPDFPILLRETMTPRTYPPVWKSDDNENILQVTFPLGLNLVNSGNTLHVDWGNRAGGNIDAGGVLITVIGVVL